MTHQSHNNLHKDNTLQETVQMKRTAKFNYGSEMICPVTCSEVLLNSYYNYLNVYHIQFKENNAQSMKEGFKLVHF